MQSLHPSQSHATPPHIGERSPSKPKSPDTRKRQTQEEMQKAYWKRIDVCNSLFRKSRIMRAEMNHIHIRKGRTMNISIKTARGFIQTTVQSSACASSLPSSRDDVIRPPGSALSSSLLNNNLSVLPILLLGHIHESTNRSPPLHSLLHALSKPSSCSCRAASQSRPALTTNIPCPPPPPRPIGRDRNSPHPCVHTVPIVP